MNQLCSSLWRTNKGGTTGWIWAGVLRWITMHYIGGCGEMDNIVLWSTTSPSCKMRGLWCTTLVDVGRWTILYYDQQPHRLARWDVVMDYNWWMCGGGQHCITNPQQFFQMRCGETDYIIYTMYGEFFEHIAVLLCILYTMYGEFFEHIAVLLCILYTMYGDSFEHIAEKNCFDFHTQCWKITSWLFQKSTLI